MASWTSRYIAGVVPSGTRGNKAHLEPPAAHRTLRLAGPGRWGTSMPSLGVPVSFAEINTASVICELALMHEGLVPDVSLGTHFFNLNEAVCRKETQKDAKREGAGLSVDSTRLVDCGCSPSPSFACSCVSCGHSTAPFRFNDLVEMDMLSLAVSPGREGHTLHGDFVRQQPNQLTKLLPSAGALAEAFRVIDSDGPGEDAGCPGPKVVAALVRAQLPVAFVPRFCGDCRRNAVLALPRRIRLGVNVSERYRNR